MREWCDGALVITPKGPSLTESDTADLIAETAGDIAASRGRTLIDLARVEYMSSAGISMLLQLRESCVQAGGPLTLSGLASPIAGVLKTTKVDRLFTIAKTREKALGKMGKNAA
jgi:anti-anti-sigma factor